MARPPGAAPRRSGDSGRTAAYVGSRSDVVAGVSTTAFPLVLLVVLFGFLAAQRWIDRGDPKVARSAGWPDHDLRFE